MSRAEHMRTTGKANDVQERMRERKYICVSDAWMRWAKKYLNRIDRRKIKNVYLDLED